MLKLSGRVWVVCFPNGSGDKPESPRFDGCICEFPAGWTREVRFIDV